jgi:hypothetical protein
MLASPLAALLYPFALEGFNTSVTRIAAGAYTLSWLTGAACLALAFAMPLIAMLAAMSFSEIGDPTVAQLRAKRTAFVAVAAPTLFTFVGVVLTMLHDPVTKEFARWSHATQSQVSGRDHRRHAVVGAGRERLACKERAHTEQQAQTDKASPGLRSEAAPPGKLYASEDRDSRAR